MTAEPHSNVGQAHNYYQRMGGMHSPVIRRQYGYMRRRAQAASPGFCQGHYYGCFNHSMPSRYNFGGYASYGRPSYNRCRQYAEELGF